MIARTCCRRRRVLLGSLLALVAGGGHRSLAVSPRTGDLATVLWVGVDRAVGEQGAETAAAFQLSQEIYWTAANALRFDVGSLDLPSDSDASWGRTSALFVTGNVSHNWLRRSAFPYVTGGVGIYAVEESLPEGGDRDSLEVGVNAGAGLEVRLGEELTFRVEARLHARSGTGPRTAATGSVGLAFYY